MIVRTIFLVILSLISSFQIRHSEVHAEELSKQIPTIVLKGELDSELAPHGKGNVYAPFVLLEDKRYRMWYGGQGKDGHDRIHYAESPDGIVWTRSGVVLENGRANHVNDPTIVRLGQLYYLYFTRTEKDVVDRIDVAISKDGVIWESKGATLAPAEEGTWDSLSIGRPAVLYEDGIFKLWYDGRKDFPPDAPVNHVPKSTSSTRSVGYATSHDGIRFTRVRQDPVIGYDIGGVDVMRFSRQLIMAYETRNGTGVAISQDGIEWTNKGVLFPKSQANFDAFGHVTPNFFIDNEGNLAGLYIGAASATTWDQNTIGVLMFPHQKLQELIGVPGIK